MWPFIIIFTLVVGLLWGIKTFLKEKVTNRIGEEFEIVRHVTPDKHPVNEAGYVNLPENASQINIAQFNTYSRRQQEGFVLLHTTYQNDYHKLLERVYKDNNELRKIGIAMAKDGTVKCCVCNIKNDISKTVVFEPCNHTSCHSCDFKVSILPTIWARYDANDKEGMYSGNKGLIHASVVFNKIWEEVLAEMKNPTHAHGKHVTCPRLLCSSGITRRVQYHQEKEHEGADFISVTVPQNATTTTDDHNNDVNEPFLHINCCGHEKV